jgi:hypothetical protein
MSTSEATPAGRARPLWVKRCRAAFGPRLAASARRADIAFPRRAWLAVRARPGKTSEVSMFFFEEKNQKTFALKGLCPNHTPCR